MAQDVAVSPCVRMLEDVPMGFTQAFAELRKMHEELSKKLALQTPVIEDLVLKAHKDEIAGARQSPIETPVCPPTDTTRSPIEIPAAMHHCDLDVPNAELEVPDERDCSHEQLSEERSGGGKKASFQMSSENGWACGEASMNTEVSMTSHNYALYSSLPEDQSAGLHEDQHKERHSRFSSCVTDWAPMQRQSSTMSEGQTATQRWQVLVHKLMGNWQSSRQLLQVKPEWHVDPNDWAAVFTKIGHSTRLLKVKSEKSVFAGTAVRGSSPMQRFVFHPDKFMARLILSLGGVALVYDLVMVPFVLCFQIDEQQGWVELANWILTVFWTSDMLVSAMTGYYEKCVVEMRPLKVLIHYFRTWGVLDMVINISDWTSLLLGLFSRKSDNSSTSVVLSAGRALKYYRFLRILRMFRLFKLVQRMGSYIDGFATEVTLVFVKLLGLIVVIVLVSHYIACVWCAIAYSSGKDVNTWMTEMETTDLLSPSDKMYVYVVAVHWSITQFTPATNNIGPVNIRERVYAVFIVFFALIMFSSFLGSLANAMAQLKKIHVERYQEEEQIRKFIFERKVSLNCARRIWNFYRTVYKSPSHHVCFDDIGFLQKLPRLLRISLHEDISMPIMCRHLGFGFLDQIDHKTMLIVCDKALTESGLTHGHEMFSTGSTANHMIFLNSGSVQYDSDMYPDLETLSAPQNICEVAVWLDWDHQGSLNAIQTCFISLLDVHSFAKISKDYLKGDVMRCMRRYAKLFCDTVYDSPVTLSMPITDVVPSRAASDFRSSEDKIAMESFRPFLLRKQSYMSDNTSANPSFRQQIFQWTNSLQTFKFRNSGIGSRAMTAYASDRFSQI